MVKIYRNCQNPFKKKILEETYPDFRVCSEVSDLIERLNVCNATAPDRPPTPGIDLGQMDDLIHRYAEDNAVIKIFIKDPYYTNIQRDEAMSTVSFVANAGGLMGLCVGLSFVSIFEIFYHIINACCVRMCGGGRRRSSADDVAEARPDS